MITEATFTLVLQIFTPLTLDRVSVHVQEQRVTGLTKAECEAGKKEATREGVKARCLREGKP